MLFTIEPFKKECLGSCTDRKTRKDSQKNREQGRHFQKICGCGKADGRSRRVSSHPQSTISRDRRVLGRTRKESFPRSFHDFHAVQTCDSVSRRFDSKQNQVDRFLQTARPRKIPELGRYPVRLKVCLFFQI